ncbi:MAG TPA: methyltransferase domain-containing protein [Candidatus Eisenbacteria bacterium]|nr:methyltransferase domain-containing protein [Candidatus Eisenbacteria bacterium]
MTETRQERDYVLGTHDDEIERLALQNRVWRARAHDAWRRAGITVGQTVLDVGCGPGYASLDLAENVGPEGRVVALDRSRRFLDALAAAQQQRGLTNITAYELDLDEDPLPAVRADASWSRWVFAFVKRPRALVERVAGVLKPGGTIIMHEYVDYATWRITPRNAEFEGFVQAVIRQWRKSGGEPDIAMDLPRWLEELGFDIRSLTPIVDIVTPANFIWQWPRTFLDVGLKRMIELGELSRDQARAITESFAELEKKPGTRMMLPTVLEIIATRK